MSIKESKILVKSKTGLLQNKSIVNDLTTKSLGNNFKEETLQNHCIQDNKNSFVNNKKHIVNKEIKHFAAHYSIINH